MFTYIDLTREGAFCKTAKLAFQTTNVKGEIGDMSATCGTASILNMDENSKGAESVLSVKGSIALQTFEVNGKATFDLKTGNVSVQAARTFPVIGDINRNSNGATTNITAAPAFGGQYRGSVKAELIILATEVTGLPQWLASTARTSFRASNVVSQIGDRAVGCTTASVMGRSQAGQSSDTEFSSKSDLNIIANNGQPFPFWQSSKATVNIRSLPITGLIGNREVPVAVGSINFRSFNVDGTNNPVANVASFEFTANLLTYEEYWNVLTATMQLKASGCTATGGIPTPDRIDIYEALCLGLDPGEEDVDLTEWIVYS